MSDLVAVAVALGAFFSLTANVLSLVFIIRTHNQVTTPNDKTLGETVATTEAVMVQLVPNGTPGE